MLAKLREDVRDGPALLFGIIRARPFVADPEAVDSHLQDFLDRVLADRLDAGEGEDRELLSAFHHTIAGLHRPLFVEKKVLVENQENQVRVQIEVTLGDGVDVLALGQQLDVFPRKEMRGAAKIAAVGTTQSGEDFSRARNFYPEDFQPTYK